VGIWCCLNVIITPICLHTRAKIFSALVDGGFLYPPLSQAQCQGDGDEGLPGEEGMAEYDSYLEEAAGTILGPLAALAGGEMFLTKFEPILPRLLKKLVGRA